jgi:hypothetical protein
MAVIEGVTAEELAAQAAGYGERFDDYVDLEVPIRIPVTEYAKLVNWCEPYRARRYEVQGIVTINVIGAAIEIERAYVMGGRSESFRSTCKLDQDDMLVQMRAHYPERTQFWSNEVGWWHLHHNGQHDVLSVGDVTECRKLLPPQVSILHLLMCGSDRGYQLSGYLVGQDVVYRLPVRILE